jgi:hypothetical protein
MSQAEGVATCSFLSAQCEAAGDQSHSPQSPFIVQKNCLNHIIND